MTFKIIKTEREYNLAIKRIEVIFDAQKGTKQGDELELLSLLINDFEMEKRAIDLPDISRPSNSEWNNLSNNRRILQM